MGEPLQSSSEQNRATRRWAAVVEYCGTDFFGWQIQQQGVRTVQAEVERIFSSVAGSRVGVRCAGRTDRGVHASHQVVHFDSDSDRRADNWLLGTNTLAAPDLSVRWVGQVDADFDARYSCYSRTYEYLIFNAPVRSAICVDRLCWYPQPLDVESMQRAALAFIGERDFSAVRAARCQARSAQRNITAASVERSGRIIRLRISANAFLLHMVRNIAGMLLEVGNGHRDLAWVERTLAAGDRSMAAPTAAPEGLYLIDLRYPERFSIPTRDAATVPLPGYLDSC